MYMVGFCTIHTHPSTAVSWYLKKTDADNNKDATTVWVEIDPHCLDRHKRHREFFVKRKNATERKQKIV